MTTGSAYAKVNGLEMYYELHGTDSGHRPLVLLHGGVLTIGLSFGAVLPALAAGRRVVAPELQGHGHTADIEREMTVPDFASDVVALLDELGIERADFLGFSLGGLTALEVAVRHPERVGRLVLAATQYTQDGYYEEVTAPDYSSPRLPSEADFQEMADAYAAVAPDPGHFQDFMDKCGNAAHTPLPWTADDLRGLTAPTLVVIGDTDFVRAEHAAEMRDLIPDARLAVLPDTTHMALMRRKELLLPMLEEFLG
ncbi:oxidoreductase [Streptomyces violarus]|uniref:Pimeloyl-ACP methyl ester carboxylesterase n=1 Tax=Streptomyces violarus TaxID=67380 RepID=A0A7W4ZU76_9ACTN|nr:MULTISPECIES: alpha/beta hydrolase [Streptomyces]MBB3078787.1 pimeloyl-ACP methyl ester carboxylesterase [Streptomyces violarus]WRU03304.1 alpha/beta hydrolase [Streptomyces sp. CGMCC 4.1772]GHD06805.1 oxidoreductase [Streptomyces violarus]